MCFRAVQVLKGWSKLEISTVGTDGSVTLVHNIRVSFFVFFFVFRFLFFVFTVLCFPFGHLSGNVDQ